MIKQIIDIEDKWKVIVYWQMDYDLFHVVADTLHDCGASKVTVEGIYDTMYKGTGKAFTYSNCKGHISIVGFKPSYPADLLNSVVHEAEHVKQAMLKQYHVKDSDEPPAYTVGYIVMRMYEVFRNITS